MRFWNNYKYRYFAVLVAIPLAGIISWKVAISETFRTYSSLQQQKKTVQNYENPDSLINALNKKFEHYSSFNISDPYSIDNYLIDFISENYDDLQITLESFPKLEVFQSTNYSVYTYKISFSGTYKDLLVFQDRLRKQLTFGDIVSVKFFLDKQRKKKDKLLMEIFFQAQRQNIVH